MQSGAMALVVAPPGRLSDGWRALLLAIPEITDVRQANDAPSALGLVEALGPQLVLLDEALGEGSWHLLDQIKKVAPQCHSIVLVCSVRQQQIALAAGADAVLLKGFSASHLADAVKRQPASQHPQTDGSLPDSG